MVDPVNVFATSAEAEIVYWLETKWGTTPTSPTVKKLRIGASEALNFSRDTLESEETRQDRNMANSILGMHRVTGELQVQIGDYHDDLLEAALAGVFTAGTNAFTSVSVSVNTIVLSGDKTADFPVGEPYFVDEDSGYDGTHTVGSTSYRTTDDVTFLVSAETLNANTAAGDVKNKVLKNGKTKKSMGIERRIHDLHRTVQFDGIRYGGIQLVLNANSMGQIRFNNIIGKTGNQRDDAIGSPSGFLVSTAGASSGATNVPIDTGTTNPAANDTFMIYPATGLKSDKPLSSTVFTVTAFNDATPDTIDITPALDIDVTDGMKLHFIRPATVVSNNDPMNAFDGAMFENGVAVTVVNSLTVNLNNNLSPAEVIGSNTIAEVIYGSARFDGTIDVFLLDFGLYDKFINGTRTSILIQIENTQSKYSFYAPNVLFTGNQFNKVGSNPLIQNIPIRIEYDTTQQCSFRIAKTPVA